MKKILFSMLISTFTFSISYGDPSEPVTSPVLATASTNLSVSGDGTHPLPFKAGDALEIISYPDTVFPSGHYPIDGEGYADFPIIGYVKVTDISAGVLAKMLSEKYVDYMRHPMMTIRPVIRVTFNGGFYRPGHYWIDPHATLWQALQIAGGTQRTDGYKKLKWERDNIVIDDNLAPVLQEGKSLYQIGFQTGDQVTVLQQTYRTRWEVFRMDVVPLITTSLSLVISTLTLFYASQYYQKR